MVTETGSADAVQLSARANVARLTLQIRATLREAEQLEAAERDDDSDAAVEQLRVRLAPRVLDRQRELDDALMAARAKAAASVAEAHDLGAAIISQGRPIATWADDIPGWVDDPVEHPSGPFRSAAPLAAESAPVAPEPALEQAEIQQVDRQPVQAEAIEVALVEADPIDERPADMQPLEVEPVDEQSLAVQLEVVEVVADPLRVASDRATTSLEPAPSIETDVADAVGVGQPRHDVESDHQFEADLVVEPTRHDTLADLAGGVTSPPPPVAETGVPPAPAIADRHAAGSWARPADMTTETPLTNESLRAMVADAVREVLGEARLQQESPKVGLDAESLAQVLAVVMATTLDHRMAALTPGATSAWMVPHQPPAPVKKSFWADSWHADVLLSVLAMIIVLVVLVAWST